MSAGLLVPPKSNRGILDPSEKEKKKRKRFERTLVNEVVDSSRSDSNTSKQTKEGENLSRNQLIFRYQGRKN
jgi:hypothetical protein